MPLLRTVMIVQPTINLILLYYNVFDGEGSNCGLNGINYKANLERFVHNSVIYYYDVISK